jgi:hypothetical protein
MMMRLVSISLFSVGVAVGGVACGDNAAVPDGPPKVFNDAPIDGAEAPMSLQDKEGGEIRFEWIQSNTNAITSRATAFFYKNENPDYHAIPPFPGCFRPLDSSNVRLPSWPLAQGTITPLDVGGVTIHNSGGDLVLVKDSGPAAAIPAGTGGCKSGTLAAQPGCDFLGRPHDLWWRKDPGSLGATDGNVMPADDVYSIDLAGSADWPAQHIATGGYMPAAWMPTTPVNTATAMLQAGTDFTVTWAKVAETNKPADLTVNFAMAFTAASGFNGPILICQIDGSLLQDPNTASFTLAAADVDYLRAMAPGGGKFVRQNLTHHIIELTDGTPRATADRKRLDILTIWCFNSPWLAP